MQVNIFAGFNNLFVTKMRQRFYYRFLHYLILKDLFHSFPSHTSQLIIVFHSSSRSVLLTPARDVDNGTHYRNYIIGYWNQNILCDDKNTEIIQLLSTHMA